MKPRSPLLIPLVDKGAESEVRPNKSNRPRGVRIVRDHQRRHENGKQGAVAHGAHGPHRNRSLRSECGKRLLSSEGEGIAMSASLLTSAATVGRRSVAFRVIRPTLWRSNLACLQSARTRRLRRLTVGLIALTRALRELAWRFGSLIPRFVPPTREHESRTGALVLPTPGRGLPTAEHESRTREHESLTREHAPLTREHELLTCELGSLTSEHTWLTSKHAPLTCELA